MQISLSATAATNVTPFVKYTMSTPFKYYRIIVVFMRRNENFSVKTLQITQTHYIISTTRPSTITEISHQLQ